MKMKKNLKITDLSHQYKNGKSIKNFNLEVTSNEIVCILGPSGSGKTTLLRLIAGFEDPFAGEIKVGNNIVFGSKYIPTEKRSIGMLFQDIALFPHLSVKNNIGFSLSKNSKYNSTINKLLKKVSLEGFADRFSNSISGGEQQRVALARALANNPDIMLLDEPFGSLDSWSKFDIALDIIKILKNSKTPTIMVSHDPQEAMRLADRIIVMLDGSIIDEGSPKELYYNSKHPFSAKLIGPTSSYIFMSKSGILNTPFGKISVNSNKSIKYEVIIRPEAFTFSRSSNKTFILNIISHKYLGILTEVKIFDANSKKNIKFLLFSNIFKKAISSKKLLFNKDWAFVFPIK
jgi:iron(III) transport system ATP-binding protein